MTGRVDRSASTACCAGDRLAATGLGESSCRGNHHTLREERGITMKNPVHSKKVAFAALGALAILFATSTPSLAAGVGGHGFGGHDGGGAFGQHDSEGHGSEGRHFEGHHFEGHHFEGHGGFGFGVAFPYYGPYYPPFYGAPSYSYYCPTFEAYYPSLTSCPD